MIFLLTLKEVSMKKLAVLIVMLSITLAGCNTVKGVGKDIQRGGESIENAAS